MNPEITDRRFRFTTTQRGDEKLSNCYFIVITPHLLCFLPINIKRWRSIRCCSFRSVYSFLWESYDFPNWCSEIILVQLCTIQSPECFGEAKYPDIFKTTSGHSQIWRSHLFPPPDQRRYSRKFLLPLKNCLLNAGGFSNELPGAHGHPGNYRKLQIAESTVKTQRQRAISPQTLKNLYTLVIFLFFE